MPYTPQACTKAANDIRLKYEENPSALSRGEANKESDNGRKNATEMHDVVGKKKKNREKTKFFDFSYRNICSIQKKAVPLHAFFAVERLDTRLAI